MDKYYNIEIDFLSDWHIGSGLGKGSYADLTPVKDEYGLPYIPGKTLKGLLRESAEFIINMNNKYATNLINETFGLANSNEENGDVNSTIGVFKFFNAELTEQDKLAIMDVDFDKQISAQEKIKSLYKRYTFTKINEKTGVVENKTLRNIEFVIPIQLQSTICIFNETNPQHLELIEKSCLFIRSLGLLRNKGFGKCSIKIKK